MAEFFKNLFKSSLVYGLGAIAGPIVAFFLLPVYTRYLTPSDYGILETLVTTTSILSIFLIFGMDNSLFRFSFDSEDQMEQRRVLATSGVFLWTLAFSVTAALISKAGFFSELMFHDKSYATLLIISFLSAAVVSIHKVPMTIFRIYGEPTKYAIISIALTLLTALFCVLFVVSFKKGVLGVMTGTLIAAVIAASVAHYLIRARLSFDISFALLMRMLRFATPVIPAGLSLWILGLSDRYFLIAYGTTREVGLYSIGAKFASIVGLGIMAFRLAWPQSAYSILNQENRDKLYARTLTYFIAAACSVVLVISLFANELLILMTTEQFYAGAKVIPLLALGLVFDGAYTIFAIGMGVTKKNAMIFPVTAIPAGINLILNYLLIPNYGMMGAAWATLVSYVIMAFLSWLASERVYHVNYEWSRLGKILSVTVGILLMSRIVTFENPYYSVPGKIGLLALYVIVLCFLDFRNTEEYGSIKRLFFGRSVTGQH